MKFDAISPAERPRIIRAVIHSGHWSGRRKGHPCQITWEAGILPPKNISFRVRVGHHWIAGWETTIADAIEAINRSVLTGRA